MRTRHWNVLGVLGAALATTNVFGQRLDLTPAPPMPNRGWVATWIAHARERLPAPQTQVEREFCRLAIAAAERGEDEELVWGLTMWERATEVSASVARAAAAGKVDASAIAAALAAISSDLTPAQMRLGLRKHLLPVARFEISIVDAATPTTQTDPASLTGFVSAVRGRNAPEDSVRAAERIADWLAMSSADPLEQLASGSVAADLAAIGALLTSMPRWLRPESVSAFEDAVWLGLTDVRLDDVRLDELPNSLLAAAALASIIETAESISDSAGREAGRRTLDLSCTAGLFLENGSAARLTTLRDWTRLVFAESPRTVVVPQLRPIHAAAVKELNVARERGFMVAASMVAPGRTLTDPEFVASRTSCSRFMERVALIERASAAIADPFHPGRARDEFHGLAGRILANAKVVAREAARASADAMEGGAKQAKRKKAEAELAVLLDEAARFAKFPQEDTFAPEPTTHTERRSDAPPSLVGRIAADRSKWLKAIANPRVSEWRVESAALAADEEVMKFLADTGPARIEQSSRLDAINVSEGWQLNRDDWNTTVQVLIDSAREAEVFLAKGDRSEALAAVRSAVKERDVVVAGLRSITRRPGPRWLEVMLPKRQSDGHAQTLASWERAVRAASP